jgi:fluoride exporter
MLAVAVALAAGAGAALRYLADLTVQHRSRSRFPYGTATVNVTGSLVLGLVVGLAAHHGLSDPAAVVLGAGLTGGYTTLSTWAWETLALGGAGEFAAACVNVVGSLAAGLAAGAAGLGLALLF